MVRRTKEDAQVTRVCILDAAELLFERQGVSRTTLQHIASAAGVTRGAIYWHFHDKAALFNAMMDRATMPLETAMQSLDAIDTSDPLHDLRECMLSVFRLVARDPNTRRVFEICTHKIEYVEELNAVRERHLASHAQWMARAESRIRIGIKHGLLKPTLPARAIALGMWALIDGLIRTWLLNPAEFKLESLGQQIVDFHLDSMRAS